MHVPAVPDLLKPIAPGLRLWSTVALAAAVLTIVGCSSPAPSSTPAPTATQPLVPTPTATATPTPTAPPTPTPAPPLEPSVCDIDVPYDETATSMADRRGRPGRRRPRSCRTVLRVGQRFRCDVYRRGYRHRQDRSRSSSTISGTGVCPATCTPREHVGGGGGIRAAPADVELCRPRQRSGGVAVRARSTTRTRSWPRRCWWKARNP